MGMIGLGVMGRNLSLNLEEKGFSVAAWDAWPEPVDNFNKQSEGLKIRGFHELPDFVKSLRRPRRIIMLVKAGQVVDDTIAKLLPLLDKGDLLVDAGNEHFTNTMRRAKDLEAQGFGFFGMGVSGGEEGARHGPSMMPGGDRKAYAELEPVLQKIAAQVSDGPCVTYIGPGAAGHYVKMVHNGIEYGDMQLIAEAYWMLKQLGGMSNAELSDTFTEWNKGELDSFLIEITSKIFKKKDSGTPNDLVDMILDCASQKGTGRWCVQDAVEIGSAIPTIASAVDARIISSMKDARVRASKVLPGPKSRPSVDKKELVEHVRAALYAAKCASYAQGLALISAASKLHDWNVNLGEVARIWKGGCIIRARFLTRIQEAYKRNPDLENLVLDESFQKEIDARQDSWREVVALAAKAGIPLPTTSISLAWYDAYRSDRLPANLIQAQRDFFGAHTYIRIDKEGSIHTQWE